MENIITIIIPYHNNAAGIVSTVNVILKSDYLPLIKEIILCHNGPRIEEFHNTVKATANIPRVKVLHDPRPGLGYGCRMGVENVSTPYLLITGSDLPFEFTDLSKWLELYKNGEVPDVVVGSKLHPQSEIKGRTLLRSLSTTCYQFIKSILIPFPVPADTQGTIFMTSEKAKPVSRDTTSDGFFYTSELAIIAIKKGATFTEVPVVYFSDERKSSVSPLKEGIRFVRSLIELRKKIKG